MLIKNFPVKVLVPENQVTDESVINNDDYYLKSLGF